MSLNREFVPQTTAYPEERTSISFASMTSVIKIVVIVGLLAIYAAVAFAVLHPHVSAAYRDFYIDHTTAEYNPSHYPSTPSEGMHFNHPGLPSWIQTARGLSVREDWGRWSDANLGPIVGLTLTQAFDGEVCLSLDARAVPWIVGQPVEVKMGSEEASFRIRGQDLTDYQLQFSGLHNAKTLDFILPPHLPALAEQVHTSNDSRRLGMNFSALRLVPGECPVR